MIPEQLGAEWLIGPGAGHHPKAEFPEPVNPALDAFYRKALAVG